MNKIDELKIRLASLKKSPVFAKLEAAEEWATCALEVIQAHEARIQALESKTDEGRGDK